MFCTSLKSVAVLERESETDGGREEVSGSPVKMKSSASHDV